MILCVSGVILFIYSFAHKQMSLEDIWVTFQSNQIDKDEFALLQCQVSLEAWLIRIVGIACVTYCIWRKIGAKMKCAGETGSTLDK